MTFKPCLTTSTPTKEDSRNPRRGRSQKVGFRIRTAAAPQLEVHRHAATNNKGIAQILSATGIDDKLRVRLNIEPLGEIELIGDLEDHFRTDSTRALQLQGPSGTIGQLGLGEAYTDFILVTGRDGTRIDKPALDVESHEITILRTESDAPKPAKSLIGSVLLLLLLSGYACL